VSIHGSGDASLSKGPLPDGVHSLIPTPAAIGCPALLRDAVLWSSPVISQRSAAPPTAHPNDDNPTIMRFSMCRQAHIESWTDPQTAQLPITGVMSTIGVLPRAVEVSNVTTRAFLALDTT
jgi:hypothetical protein